MRLLSSEVAQSQDARARFRDGMAGARLMRRFTASIRVIFVLIVFKTIFRVIALICTLPLLAYRLDFVYSLFLAQP
jgi:hypothetical protein